MGQQAFIHQTFMLMTLTLRKLQVLFTHRFKAKIEHVHEEILQTFRVLPIDLDENLHMNNGRYINYMEVARWELMLRSGFLPLGLKEKWIAPLAALKVNFIRPFQIFQKFDLRTEIVFWDEKWIYIRHQFFHNEKLHTDGFAKVTIRGKQGSVQPEDVYRKLGIGFESKPAPKEIQGLFF